MSLTTVQNTGYLEPTYLDGPYLGGSNLGVSGAQFLAVIDGEKVCGTQFQGTIASSKICGAQFQGTIASGKTLGVQFLAIIQDYKKSIGTQFQGAITSSETLGAQFLATIDETRAHGSQFLATLDTTGSLGSQFYSQQDVSGVVGSQFFSDQNDTKGLGTQFQGAIAASKAHGVQFLATLSQPQAFGVEFRSDNGIFHTLVCEDGGYLQGNYLNSSTYLTANPCAHMGVQFQMIGATYKALGVQFHATIDTENVLGSQFRGTIDYEKAQGVQFLAGLATDDAEGAQFQGVIDIRLITGFQFLSVINAVDAYATQFDSVRVGSQGVQFNVVIYNTTNLRILCHFASRGTTDGDNWTSNSSAPGHFKPKNLNTDVTEEVWKSASGVVTGINLICDTEVAQGIYMDTLAILNHNLTTSASVSLQASNDPTFSVIGQTIPLLIGSEENFYYIADEYPFQAYRYWRFQISDPTNPDEFCSIGTILFGSATIFQGECFVDEVGFTLLDFADTVKTAGFNNVGNSRALRKRLELEFRYLRYNVTNFRQLRNMFRNERTIIKCLWIPTPDIQDQEYTARFAIFGKLVTIPRETHKAHSKDADYVSLNIEIDDSL